MNVRCPVCGEAVKLAVGDMRLACSACGLAAPLSNIGTAPGVAPSATLALEADLVGATVAKYELVERIGAGGMGTVYRARRVGADPTSAGAEEVAVKVLRPGLGVDRAAMLARFTREAEAMRRLDHPRVVRLLDHGEDGDVAYIVTELVDGRDLAARLASGRMTWPELVDVFGQVCDGVAAAHAAGIVHRDLKPANILVGKSGVKVADFGLAQLGADVAIPTLTRTNVAMGTFHYLSPEQRKNAHAVDHRADVWALGVILYEMIAGELPLGAFAPPSTLGPEGCDRRVDGIVQRALAPDPAARYQSVAAFASDVRALVAPKQRKRGIAIAAGAIALAGATTAVAMSMSSSATTSAGPSATSVAAPTSIDAAIAMPDAVDLASVTPDAAVVAESGSGSAGSGAEPALAAVPVIPVGKPSPVKEGGKIAGGKGKIPVGKVPVGKPAGKKPPPKPKSDK